MIKIGISTQIDSSSRHDENRVHMDYIQAVIEAGGLPILVPVTLDQALLDAYLTLIDGLILTGGCDVSPTLYGEPNLGLSVRVCDMRDKMELYLLQGAIDRQMPVLGICRGMQLINVHFGGTLYQDLMTQYHTEIDHINSDAETSLLAHKVRIEANSLLGEWLNLGIHAKIDVNSRHHQAIKKLGKSLNVVGRAPDQIIEAIENKALKIVGVQWHPEDLVPAMPLQTQLFKAYINQCRIAIKEETHG